MTKSFTTITFVVAVVTLVAQEPGDLNMAFGQDGIYTEVREDTASFTGALGVLSDGSLIVAGNYYDLGPVISQVSVFKLNSMGHLWPFGNSVNGFEYNISLDNDVSALCILPDDRVVISVSRNETFEGPHLIMLNADGEPVMDFGENGVFTDPRVMYVKDIDFMIYEGGYYFIMCGGSLDSQPLLMMIDQTGEPVSSFGDNGMYTLTSIEGRFTNMVIDRNSGQMYLSGTESSSPDSENFLAKYILPEGYRDSGFGVDGILSFSESTGFTGSIKSIVYDSSSNTLAALGNYLHPEEDRDIFAYRVNGDDGTADNSFGINGWSSLRVPVSNESINSALLQPDGKYCFGGRTDYHGNGDFLIGRVNAAGLLDVSFGSSGLSTTEIYPEKDNSIAAVALSPDSDMLYAAGNTDTPKEYSMAIAAYYTGFGQGTGSGGENNFSEWVKVSPNPVEDQCRFHTGQAGFHQVRIFNAAGKIVFDQSHHGENAEFNLGFLPPGVYIIQVILPEKQVGTYKLLKH